MSERPPSGPAGNADRPVLYLRRTRRVARVWEPLDGLLYNVIAMNVVVMFNFPLLIAMIFYPHGSLTAAIIITGVVCLAQAVVYAFLASSMPRSGGDYLFQSRLLSGAVGTVYAFTAVVLGGAMWMAIGGWFAANVVVAPVLITLGYLRDAPWLVRAGELALTPTGVFLAGLVVTGWAGLVNTWGMRTYARLQRVGFAVGTAALAAALVMLLTSDHQDFVGGLNALLAGHTDTPDAYAATIARAREMGYAPAAGGAVSSTLALLPVAAFALIYPAWSVQQAGEIKRGGELRPQLLVFVGAELVATLFAAALVGLAVSRIGTEFLGSAAYLWTYHREALPLPVGPFFGFLLGVAGPGGMTALAVVATLTTAWFWMWAPDITLAASRVLLAMASDRLLPAGIARIGARSKAPVRAIGLFSAACAVAACLYAFTDFWRLTLDATVLNVLAFAVTCVAGAVFPFTKRELYRESTAARYELKGIPVITIAGGIFVAFAAFVVWRFLVDDALALGVSVPVSLLFVLALYAGSLGLFIGMRRYRRAREGVDIELVYREIPVD